MSAGSSSQLAACFSVDLTKYLMLSKSMPDRSAPQLGMGLRPKFRSPWSRSLSIHSGSFFRAEMSRTTSSDRPRRAEAPATSESAQPNLYVPSPSSWSCVVVVMSRALRTLGVFSGYGYCNSLGRCRLPDAGDVRGADAVAVRDRSEPPYRGAKQPAESLGLGLAELRELGRHVRHRAVVLAELRRTFADPDRGRGARGRGVAVGGQRLGQRLDPAGQLSPGHRRRVPALQVGHLPAGELGDRLRARRLGQETQRTAGQVVVGVLEGTAARVGDDKHLGRAAPAPVPVGPGRPGLDEALGQQVVQMAADGGGREPEPAAERGRGGRPELEDQPRDLPPGGGTTGPAAGRGTRRSSVNGTPGGGVSGSGFFHNIIVS